MAFEDILYEKRDGVATITINRPRVLNAFRAETVEEMLQAMRADRSNDRVPVIMISAIEEPEIRRQAQGYEIFLRKPFSLAALLEAIARLDTTADRPKR